MKKYKTFKEIDAATFDNSRLPLKNCTFSNCGENWSVECDTLAGIHYGAYPFVGGRTLVDDYRRYAKCAEVIERYPRDVPEGVTELPEDKPFLAYVGEMSFGDIKKLKCHLLVKESWIHSDCGLEDEWVYHAAIDVSTEEAEENFPEIVEAMEYEEVTSEASDGEVYTIGHNLGDKMYNSKWESIDDDLKVEEEPPDYQEYDDKEVSWVERKHYFEAGKARGKWEERQRWKDKI